MNRNGGRSWIRSLYYVMISNIRRLNIFYRLLFSFLLVIIVPSLIIGYFAIHKYSSQIELNNSKYSNQMISMINKVVSERLVKYEDLSYRIYSDESIVSLLNTNRSLNANKAMNAEEKERYDITKRSLNHYLYEISQSSGLILNIEIVTDIDEYTQISRNNEIRGAFLRDINVFRQSDNYIRAIYSDGNPVWFDTSKENNVYASQIMQDHVISNYITLLRELPDPSGGKPLGVIVMNISTKVFAGMFGNSDISNNVNLLLLSDHGVIYSLNENINGPILDQHVATGLFHNNKRNFVTKINGQECFVVLKDFEYTGWTLASLIPMDNLLSSVFEVQKIIVLTSVICMIIATIISFFVTISIYYPLNRLKKTMVMMDEKNMDLHYADDIHDEIGMVGQLFNTMVTRIRSLINAIYEAELNQNKEAIRRKNAQWDAMQMQINSHFLYNTLDMIRWEAMSLENGEGRLSQMIAYFAGFLRLGTKKNDKLVSIQEEIEHAETYLKVLSFRQRGEIVLHQQMEEGVLECLITKLSLQPIVENAIVHGLARRKNDKEIAIKAFRSGGDIIIEIRDNGIGMEPEKIARINEEISHYNSDSSSLGLKNINERLQLFFGEQYGLRVASQLGQGTCVSVQIPYMKAEEDGGIGRDV
ncbi:sensor histidine kinase [Paenibacillus sp. OV219]|uniref:sensor histidine kinase n=1 Tax=Paenibacillus sp. OV219 TaxID=1884377 RepID=UPI0008ADA4E3|nr:sensor histidine kinase [Paenibacillus sp. OV219]SEO05152.1 HAMP domain-containing protein [Paenibacillus sp. OV219]